MEARQSIEREFASQHVVPVEQLLGPRTLHAVKSPRKVTSLILQKANDYKRRRLIDEFTALTARRTLSDSQLHTLQDIVFDPESYWNGWPKYRRLPPKPGFGFEISGEQATVHLLVDLQNPGWEFCSDGETYWGFNFAGPRLAQLAKEIFAEYASPHRGSVWRKGIIKELERAAASAT